MTRQSEDAAGDEDEGELSLDVAFTIVRNERRRLLLRILRDHGEGRMSLSELAERIAAHENDKSVQAINSKERKRAYVGLYQSHLPLMDEADVVDFDRNAGVALAENADQLDQYLGDESEPVPWYQYYGVLTGVGVVGFASAAVLSAGAVDFSGLFLGAFLVMMACLVGVHAYVELSD